MTFVPGKSGNPNGRQPGSRNKRTEALWRDLKDDLDPAVYLSSLVTNKEKPDELRALAANYLLPYKYSKCGSTVPLRFIAEPVELPHPSSESLDQVRRNIGHISNLLTQGQLDLDFANRLIADQQTTANIMIEEIKLAAQGQGSGEQVIRIEGGMGQLPGTSIIGMENYPQVNGHNGHAPVIDHPETPALNESVTTKAGDP